MRFAVGYVFGNAAGEEDGFLADHADASAEGLGVHGADVLAVDGDGTFGWGVES